MKRAALGKGIGWAALVWLIGLVGDRSKREGLELRARSVIAVAAVTAATALVPAPATAEAGKRLSIAKASTRTERVARDWCERKPDCTGSGASNCRRLAPRRVSCVASIAAKDYGGNYQCDRLVIVRIRREGGLKHGAGKPRCYST